MALSSAKIITQDTWFQAGWNEAAGTVRMTIEIHKPELEALINERLKSGAFENVEDVLMQALRGSAIPAAKETRTAAALVAAMQACPYEDVDFEPKKITMPTRDVTF